MYIPKTMTKKIAEIFYDKEIKILLQRTTTDTEGGVSVKGYDVADTFKGNVNFSSCKKIQEEYGLDYSIDISITTYINADVNIGDLIKYDEVVYVVNDKLLSDSHIMVVATKWRQ